MCSFRAGAGKTTLAANLAALWVARGMNVCLVDANLRAPELHNLFGIDEAMLTAGLSLADYLHGLCAITDSVRDITPYLGQSEGGTPLGKLYLTSALGKSALAIRLANEGYNLMALRDGLESLFADRALDYIVIDTYAGMDERTLPLIAMADVLLITMLLDKQDFQGTGVVVDVARKFDVPDIFLVVNSVAVAFEDDKVRGEAEHAYKCKVAAVVPYDLNMLDPDTPRNVELARLDTPIALALGGAAAEIAALPDFEGEDEAG
jgi:MinD-like ATPase involved in chromosome partitioning or flagellar assembly